MELLDVDGDRSFGSQLLLEADPVTFTQTPESFSLYAFVMHEQVFTTVRCDETVTLGVIEPFHYAFHDRYPFVKIGIKA